MDAFKPRYFLLLLGTQFLLLTPYVFFVAVVALFRTTREWFTRGIDDRTRLLLLNAAVPIALFTVVSFRSIVKLNWLMPAFWSLVVLGVGYALAREGGLRTLVRGLASSAAILVAAGIALAIPNLPVPGDLNAWSGWKDAAARADRAAAAAARDTGKTPFIFAPNYKISSLIRFYLPGQPRTYAQDIYGERALQYDFFPLPNDLAGATGILVLSDQDQSNMDRAKLKPFFDACEPVDLIEAAAFGKTTRRVEILRCTNYKGHPPRGAARGDQPD
jgi:hypothetical protein